MQILEPTYLRYVYDGLLKGSFSSNNASALPHGFIGLFEEEFFPASMPSNDRNKLLKRLALWALFKGSVSTEMASNILAEDINDSKTLIDRYSKWFNTPEPGKYILYHDRLKTYLLQKLSDHEVQELNEALIIFLVAALEQNDSSEAELYALDHLSTHMAVESELNNNYERLHNYVNREDIWQRQVKASKEYKWSQKGVSYAIKEGARRHHEMNTLTATVNSVKLMQEEQNSAKQILEFLNEGDYETALKRAEVFDGEKLMTLYLLMIHELTIGKSKDADFRVKECKNIINKISEINYTNSEYQLFPGLAIYKYHEELKKIEVDDRILLDKLSFHSNFIINLLNYQSVNKEILYNLISSRCSMQSELVPIYIKIAEINFSENQVELGSYNIGRALDVLYNINPDKPNEIYGRYNDEDDLRYILDYCEYFFGWCNYIFKLCNDHNLSKRLINIYDKQYIVHCKLEKLILKNNDLIKTAGTEGLYYSEYFKQKQSVVENQIILTELDSSYYRKASEFNINFQSSFELYTGSSLGWYGYKKNNYEIKLASYLFKTKQFNSYTKLLESVGSDFLRGKIILNICKSFLNNADLDFETNINTLFQITDQMEFGTEVFLLSEDCYEFLFENNLNKLGEKFLNQSVLLAGRLANKSQRFYCDRLPKIIGGYSYLNNIIEIEKYFKIYCDTIPQVLSNRNIVSNLIGSVLSNVSKSDNLNCIYKVFDLITSNEHFIKNNSSRLHYYVVDCLLKQNKNEEAFRYCIKNKCLPYRSDFGSYIGEKWNQDYVEAYGTHPDILIKDSKKFITDSSILLKLIITLNEQSCEERKPYNYVLNQLVEEDKLDAVFGLILNDISTSFIEKTHYTPEKNAFICNEIIKKLNYNEGLNVIDLFDFDENIYSNIVLMTLHNRWYQNIKVSYLLENINKQNIDVLLEIIYSIINSHKDFTGNATTKKSNKLLGFTFLSKKLKELGFKSEAKKTFELWLNESPKEIVLNTRHHKDSSGLTIEMLEFSMGLFSNDEVLDKIDVMIDENNDNSETLLTITEILYTIGRTEKAIKLAKSILKVIPSDPFMYDDLRTAHEGMVAKFFYKIGDFKTADEIHLAINDHLFDQPTTHNYSQFSAKSEYFLKIKSYDKIVSLVKNQDLSNFSNRFCQCYDINKVVENLTQIDEHKIVSEIINLTYNTFLKELSFNQKISLLKTLFIIKNEDKFQNLLSHIVTIHIVDSKLNYENIHQILLNNSNFIELYKSVTAWNFTDQNSIIKMLFANFSIPLEIGMINEFISKNISKVFPEELNNVFEKTFDNKNDYKFLIKNINGVNSYNTFLFHKAKMACFFEKERDEEKLDLLAQVIDISEWRKISEAL